MGQISLLVTSRVLERDSPERLNERQIAYRSPSEDLKAALGTASSTNRMAIDLGEFVTLVVGDTSAVWRSHNVDRARAFDAFFGLLSQRPDREMRVLCDMTPPTESSLGPSG